MPQNKNATIRYQALEKCFNEFCYKFNRRYFGDRLFDRLVGSITYTPGFKHRVYNWNLSVGRG